MPRLDKSIMRGVLGSCPFTKVPLFIGDLNPHQIHGASANLAGLD